MIDNLYKISLTENDERRAALTKLLDDNDVPYCRQTGTYSQEHAENIIVSFGICARRIIFGAHYDSVDGSTGANDNASGVLVMLELAKYLSSLKNPPDIDIVFFDMEETGGIGGGLYLENMGAESIRAMVNFDICGTGEVILTAPLKNAQNPPFYKAFKKLDSKKHEYKIIDKLPTGDERIFEENKVPNLSVCILPREDVEPMETLFSKGDDVSPDDFPSIIETMHNGPRDTIEVVEESAMRKLVEFAKDLAMALAEK